VKFWQNLLCRRFAEINACPSVYSQGALSSEGLDSRLSPLVARDQRQRVPRGIHLYRVNCEQAPHVILYVNRNRVVEYCDLRLSHSVRSPINEAYIRQSSNLVISERCVLVMFLSFFRLLTYLLIVPDLYRRLGTVSGRVTCVGPNFITTSMCGSVHVLWVRPPQWPDLITLNKEKKCTNSEGPYACCASYCRCSCYFFHGNEISETLHFTCVKALQGGRGHVMVQYKNVIMSWSKF